jgi:hypothetical protein
MSEQPPAGIKDMPPIADKRKMYIRLRVLHRLGLLGPVLRLHRRIDPR